MPETEHYYRLIFGIIVGVLVLAVAGFFIFFKNGAYVTQTVERGTFTRSITVTGEVVPADEVTLAFTSSGRVTDVFITEGQQVGQNDVLARLDQSTLSAELRQALADRDLANAELGALVGVQETDGKTQSIKREAVSVIEKALSVAKTQTKTRIDELYDSPQSARPQVTTVIGDYFTQQTLNQERVVVRRLLEAWEEQVENLSADTVTEFDAQNTVSYLNEVSAFVDALATALSSAEPVASVGQARLTEFRSLVSSARTAINTAIDEVIMVRESLRATLADVPVQEARVLAAQASIDRYQALLDEYELRSPFEGVATIVDVSTGEIVAANQELITLISNEGIELEVFVPEVNIAHLDVGDRASVTLDAFGDELVLGAMVVAIDVRATERSGVATYKTKLLFDEAPASVRAGMTATIVIDTQVDPGVIVIPRSVIILDGNGNSKVKVLQNEQSVTRQIETGRTDTSGGVEVLSGLEEGEVIIISQTQ